MKFYKGHNFVKNVDGVTADILPSVCFPVAEFAFVTSCICSAAWLWKALGTDAGKKIVKTTGIIILV